MIAECRPSPASLVVVMPMLVKPADWSSSAVLRLGESGAEQPDPLLGPGELPGVDALVGDHVRYAKAAAQV